MYNLLSVSSPIDMCLESDTSVQWFFGQLKACLFVGQVSAQTETTALATCSYSLTHSNSSRQSGQCYQIEHATNTCTKCQHA